MGWREGQGPELLLGGVCPPPAGGAETCSLQKNGDPGYLATVFPSAVGTGSIVLGGQQVVPETDAGPWTLEV